MIKLFFVSALLLNINIFAKAFELEESRASVFCYYDSRSFFREGHGKVVLDDIKPALSHCTHLVYGYAAISSINYKMIPLNQDLDVGVHHKYYSKVTELKTQFPDLKVLISLGGGADEESPEKYLKLLENTEARQTFMESVVKTLKEYDFDGIDLAWQFPPDKPKRRHSTLGNIWQKIKHTFKKEKSVDEDFIQHSDHFKQMIKDLSTKLRAQQFIITVSVLPNVNSLMFYNYYSLSIDVDYVILHAYDFYTPERHPKEADHANPILQLENRFPDLNVDSVVTDWTANFPPKSKIILGIPTYGRAWKIYPDCQPTGHPPVRAKGPAPQGPLTNEIGLLGYFEICRNVTQVDDIDTKNLEKFFDSSKKCGPYAYKIALENHDYGIWVSYEDPDDISDKIAYLKEKKLGGVAIVDLTLDDYKGVCNDVKFPLLNSVTTNLKLYTIDIRTSFNV